MNAKRDERPPESAPLARESIVRELIERGVIIPDPDRTYVDESVSVAARSTLYPGTHLRGKTSIGPECRIGPDCWIEDSSIEGGCVVRYSVIESSRIRADSSVGPYAHLRPGADIGPEARVGNFVEVKAARLERGAKAGHLAYIGDADIGPNVNVGAGTVTCNYDGSAKNRTVIEAGAFIGSNASLVAPVRIGEGAIVAAGSTITEDVPARSKAFGRARQVIKPETPKSETPKREVPPETRNAKEGESHDR
jgi:bifunctional UDP-N-acetylglucosamine pyrophosphorylase/glucosamine-1-phosphate N-acetyltransferase